MTASPAERMARAAARAAREKKAEGVAVLDLTALSTVADFFLVCSGRSATHADTIVEAVQKALRGRGVRVRHREGTAESGWLLLDYGDVLVHVFLDETRAFYALERLWGDAPVLDLGAEEAEHPHGVARGD